MDTVDKLSKYCKENGVEDVFVVGAPKTIDNDLVGTDHWPGSFGSLRQNIWQQPLLSWRETATSGGEEGCDHRGGHGKKRRMADGSVCSVPRQRRRRDRA